MQIGKAGSFYEVLSDGTGIFSVTKCSKVETFQF